MERTTARPKSLVQMLDDRLPGRVIWPDDKHYPATRAVWNATVDHRPAAIVQPRSAEEVGPTIIAARQRGSRSPSAAAATALRAIRWPMVA